MSRSRSYHVCHKAKTFSAVGLHPLTFGRTWVTYLILGLALLCASSPSFSPCLIFSCPNLIPHHKHFILFVVDFVYTCRNKHMQTVFVYGNFFYLTTICLPSTYACVCLCLLLCMWCVCVGPRSRG